MVRRNGSTSPAVAVLVASVVLAAVGSTAYAAGMITGADIKDGSVRGVDVRESSLSMVPRAAAAGTVGGAHVRAFELVTDEDLTEVEVARVASLSLHASCTDGQTLLSARTTSADAQVSYVAKDAKSGGQTIENQLDDFTVDQIFLLPVPPGSAFDDVVGELRYADAEGVTLSVDVTQESDPVAGRCVAHGYAVGAF